MAQRLTVLAILWTGLVTAPLRPLEAREARQETLRAYVLKKQGRQAYGIYLGPRKMGWLIEELKLGKYAGKEAAIHSSEAYIATAREGEKSVIEVKSNSYFELAGEGRLVFAEERKVEDKTETIFTGVREKNELVLITKTKNRKTQRRVPLPRESLEQMRRLDRWLLCHPAQGATFESYSTSLDQKNVEIKEAYVFREKKTILWGGVRTTVYSVKVSSQGVFFNADLQENGNILQSKIGGLLDLRAEKENLAKKLDGESVDLMAASSIYVTRRMGSAKKIEALTLKVSGLGDFTLPASHRQRVRPGKDGTAVVELRRDRRLEKTAPLSQEQRQRYLRSSSTVQADDPTIRKLALKVAGGEKDPIKAAGQLEKWVYDHLRKTMAANASTALDVLENRAGDCTEHTLLFVTLARAAGIPAREVGGLAYLNSPRPLFGWHAWAEIHDGRQWVTVDPTWNEVYVDATHLKFSEGSEDLAFVNVIGTLKLKIVDFKTSPWWPRAMEKDPQ
jgi:transglutaminase-like putative cysteine protease